MVYHQHNDHNNESKKLPRFFHPRCFRLHGTGNIFRMMLGHPVYQPVSIKCLINGISAINHIPQPISSRVKLIPCRKITQRRRIQVYRHPYIRVRIVVLQCSKDYKSEDEEVVEDFHEGTVRLVGLWG